jgi:glycosyltransferase involved in cell wall biosynthesis
MRRRVLEIIPTLVRGGAEKQFAMLATQLPASEFEVQVAVLTHTGPLEESLRAADIPVTIIGKRWKIDPLAYRRLKRLIAEFRPDIVHTWIFAANCYGRLAARAQHVPHIVACERCVDQWKVWHELTIDRYLARHTECIVTNSSGVRDFYAEHGIAAEKFVVIPNGIEPFQRDTTRLRGALIRELNLPLGTRLIGAVGRLWPQKRYKDLIWAAELLRVARGDTHLLIIGEGPQRDMLQRFCDEVRVTPHVHFLGQRDDVAAILTHLDCFWLGSGYEGQSNSLMEAMSAGLPVIASDIPGNRDLIVPDESGYLVGVGDSGEIARKTNILLNDAALAKSLGERARQRMLEEFSVARMVDQYAQLFRGLTRSGENKSAAGP